MGLRKLFRDRSLWIICAFVGFMFATAVTGPIPAVADWQSGFVCGSGEHFVHDEYTTQTQGATQPDGSAASAATGVGFTYRCVGPNYVSGSRTAIVLAVQFIAGTIGSFLICCAFAVRRGLKRRRAARDGRSGAAQPV